MNILFDNQNMIIHNNNNLIIVDFRAAQIRRFLCGERIEVIDFSKDFSLKDLENCISDAGLSMYNQNNQDYENK